MTRPNPTKGTHLAEQLEHWVEGIAQSAHQAGDDPRALDAVRVEIVEGLRLFGGNALQDLGGGLTRDDGERLGSIATRIASELDPELYSNEEANRDIRYLRQLSRSALSQSEDGSKGRETPSDLAKRFRGEADAIVKAKGHETERLPTASPSS